MRYTRLFFIVIGFIFVTSTCPNVLSQTDGATPSVRLSVSSAKETYIRGEIVKLTAHIENRGSEGIRVYTGRVDPNEGTVLFVSRDGTNYGQYLNTSYKGQGGGRAWVEPGENFDKELEILWNLKPDVTGRSPLNVEEVTRGKILTDYVFPTAGTYLVKVVFLNVRDSQWRQLSNFESEPIEITVVEPRDDDLAVWRLIENRPDIAYFVQNTTIQKANSEAERVTRSRELRDIAQRYPNSIIARQIGQKLEEYRIRLGRSPWEPRAN